MATTAARLQIVVEADTSKADSGLDSIGNKADGLGSKLGGALATGAMAAGAGIAAGLAVGIKAAGDLEQGVANISTIKPEIDNSAVFASLNEMTTRIPQSGKQLSDAMYNVFSSFSTDTDGALKLTETFARGAVGAATDAETFGTSILGVMNAYGSSVDDAAHISDVFFNTVNAGVVSGQELASSLGPVTQSAKAAGVSIDELGGLIAGVTKEGGPAAQNINNLNNFLQKVTTTEAQKAMGDLGVKVTDATGKFRPTTEVLADLKEHLGGMTDAAKANALQAIFPDAQARQGAVTLMSQLDAVNDTIKTNREATGSAAAAYEKMSATFNSQSKLLMNTVTSILTTIGAALLPAITPLIKGFAEWLPGAFKTATEALTPFMSAISGVFAFFTTEVGSDASLAGFSKLQTALDGIFGSERAATIAGFASDLKATFDTVATTIGDAWSTVKQVFAGDWSPDDSINPIVNAIGMVATVIRDVVIPAVAEVGGFILEQFGTVVAWFRENWPLIQQTFAVVFGAIEAFWQAHGATVVTLIGLAWDTIKTTIGTTLDVVLGLVRATMQVITGDWSGAWSTIKGLVVEVVGAIGHILGNDLKAAFAVIDDITGGALTTVATWIDNVSTALSDAWATIKGVAQIAWDVHAGIAGVVVSALGDLLTSADQALNAAGTGLVALAAAGWDAIKGGASTAWTAAGGIVESVGSAWDSIKTNTANVLTDAPDAIATTIANAWDTVKSGLDTIFGAGTGDTITGLVATAWGNVKEGTRLLMEDPATGVKNLLSNSWNDVKTGLDAVFGAGTGDTISGVVAAGWAAISSGADTLMNDPVKGVKNILANAWGAVKTGLDLVFGAGTGDTITGLVSTAWGAISTATDSIFGEGKGVRKLFSDAMAIMKAAVDPVAQILGGTDGNGGLIGLINKLKEIVPAWLIPHSPTPFEVGLRGIMKAAEAMDGAFGNMGGGLEGIAQIAALATSIGGVDFGKAAAAISASETGGGRDLHEIGGTGAVGPFMFDPGGELKNFARDLHVSIAEAARIAMTEPMKAAAWALHGYLGTALRAGIGEGLSGANLAMFGSRYGQRPAGDNWKKAGEWYDRIYGYAEGGIALTPQIATLAENGPELITPLSALRSGMGGTQTAAHELRVTVNVGSALASKREIAEAVVLGITAAVDQRRLPASILGRN